MRNLTRYSSLSESFALSAPGCERIVKIIFFYNFQPELVSTKYLRFLIFCKIFLMKPAQIASGYSDSCEIDRKIGSNFIFT